MKKLFFASIAGLALSLSAVAYAAAAPTESEQPLRAKRMEECFQAHASLMDKPAVRNRVNCWMSHRHLMQG